MSFNSQLEGFVSGFVTGTSLVKSKREREAEELVNRVNKARAALAEEELTPEGTERRRRRHEAEIGLSEAQIARYEELNEASRLARSPEERAAVQAERESEQTHRAAQTRSLTAGAEKQEIENEREKGILSNIKRKADEIARRMKGGSASLDEGAVPAETPQATPAPASAVDTGTHSPEAPAIDPDTANPQGVAEAVPITKPEALGEDQTGARSDTYQYVDEQQGQVAGIRKQPLDPATRDVLQHAGSQTGIRAVVYSGGQAGKGEEGPRTGSTRHDHGMAADVRLYDAKTGKLLDMRNPEDAERMKQFGAAAVQAGATGIGAGEGYMGPSSMHIGFGKEASWGGASWIEEARKTGMGMRGAMPVAGGTSAKAFDSSAGERSMVDIGHEAVKVGLMAAASSYGLDKQTGVDTPESLQATHDFVSGADAADPDQMDQVEKVVKEMAGEELTESELSLYTLAATYYAYMEAGKPEEAAKAAQAIIGHYQKLFAQYGAMAKAAAAKGDIPEAIDLAVRAYANVPNGVDMSVNKKENNKYEVVFKDLNGKTQSKSLHTPEEMVAMVMEINPANFVSFITQAAGQRTGGKASGAAEGADGAKLEDREKAAELIDATIEQFITENKGEAEALGLGDATAKGSVLSDVKSIAANILRDNNIMPDRALLATVNLIQNGAAGGVEEISDQEVRVHMAGMDPIVMSINDFAVLEAHRTNQRIRRGAAVSAEEGVGPTGPVPVDQSSGASRVGAALGKMFGAVPTQVPARVPVAPAVPVLPEWLQPSQPNAPPRGGVPTRTGIVERPRPY